MGDADANACADPGADADKDADASGSDGDAEGEYPQATTGKRKINGARASGACKTEDAKNKRRLLEDWSNKSERETDNL